MIKLIICNLMICVLFLNLNGCMSYAFTKVSRIHKSKRNNDIPLIFSRNKQSNILRLSKNDLSQSNNYVYSNLLLPLILSFPLFALIHEISDFNISTFYRQAFIVGLLLYKRIYLYIVSFLILDSASKLAATNYKPGLGERLLSINQEILPVSVFDPFSTQNSTNVSGYSNDVEISGETRNMYANIDSLDQNILSIILPIFLAGSLFVSYAIISQLQLSTATVTSAQNNVFFVELLRTVLPLISNIGICTLFVNNIISKEVTQKNEKKDKNMVNATLAFSILFTLFSFLIPPGGGTSTGTGSVLNEFIWPLHNFINACLCIQVSRILQVNTIYTTILALAGLTAYDFLATSTSQMYTDNGNSIMEAVATAKLGLSSSSVSSSISSTPATVSSGSNLNSLINAASSSSSTSIVLSNSNFLTNFNPNELFQQFQNSFNTILNSFKWRPGLIEVAVRGKVTDALGLGDIVFPAILTGWALRYDIYKNKKDKIPSTLRLQKNHTQIDLNLNNQLKTKSQRFQSTELLNIKNISKTNNKLNNNEYKLYKSCLTGYIIGCILCDASMMTGMSSSSGIPALIFLVPSMFASVALSGIINNDWQDILLYNSTDINDE